MRAVGSQGCEGRGRRKCINDEGNELINERPSKMSNNNLLGLTFKEPLINFLDTEIN